MAAVWSVRREIGCYRRERDRLRASHRGEFVLVKGDAVVGTFPSRNAAVDEGNRRYAGEPFLVVGLGESEDQAWAGGLAALPLVGEDPRGAPPREQRIRGLGGIVGNTIVELDEPLPQ